MHRLAFILILASSVAAAQTCPGETWQHADPAVSGWSSEGLRAIETVAAELDTSALVVVHQGRIVLERGAVSTPLNLYSGRKSVLSVLYGIAHDSGRARLDATLDELGIDDEGGLSAVEKTATVRHLLQARSCIYHQAEYETASMKHKRPARGSCRPGERWHYNNWDFNALASTYREQTGRNVFEGLAADLAAPLRFENFDPRADTRFHAGTASRHPAYLIQLSARDFARIGLLMSRRGNWCGRQILSTEWWQASTAVISATDRGAAVSYGYLWWTSPSDTQFRHRFDTKVFSARGNGGQYLLVVPAEDLVIAHLTARAANTRRVSSTEFGRIVQAVMAAKPAAH